MSKDIPYIFRMCKNCKEIKFICKFKKNKNSKFGFEYKCKKCYKEYNKKYRKENKEDILKRERKYKKEHKEDILNYNKELHREGYYKKYYKNNKEKYNIYNKEYYESNKEKILENNKKWREKNPEKLFNNNIRRRQKEENQGNGITKEQWHEMMIFFDFKCAYSDEYIGGDSNNRTIDHIIPLNNGGEHEIWNCVPMLNTYNFQKHTKDMLEWYLEQSFFQ